jgi:phosphoglycolate phosphatase-like HAD superfamily hydrolase
VTTGRTPRAALEEAGADVVFDDLSDLDAAHAALFS